ncbi:hypothetical protein M514_18324 [Trichuris suis]|uniref:Uncharacterized protein n=1 Tax=Trichuris suis TaxID=68888 RepID=A0A085NJ06_9BILA|nr:hypothetical protein M514_18324 [Trichuris suis]
MRAAAEIGDVTWGPVDDSSLAGQSAGNHTWPVTSVAPSSRRLDPYFIAHRVRAVLGLLFLPWFVDSPEPDIVSVYLTGRS